jgi:hypothetical protein
VIQASARTASHEIAFRKPSPPRPGIRKKGSTTTRLVGGYWNFTPRPSRTAV